MALSRAVRPGCDVRPPAGLLATAEKSAAPRPRLRTAPTAGRCPGARRRACWPACGEGPALLAAMSTRDKLAQLLMVGVTGAADARAVVDSHHVGGIFIGSWTDLSMLSDGSLTDIAKSAGPLPLAVSVDEEGGRVSRLAELIGSQPSPRVLAKTRRPKRCTTSRCTWAGDAQARHHRRLRARRRRHRRPDDAVIGDRSFGADPAAVTEYAGAYARGLRDAGLLPVLKHFPGHGHGSGDSHTGRCRHPAAGRAADRRSGAVRTLTAQAPGRPSWSAPAGARPDRQRSRPA